MVEFNELETVRFQERMKPFAREMERLHSLRVWWCLTGRGMRRH